MRTHTQTRRRHQRNLLEDVAISSGKAPLKIDRVKKIIYGVKVLGRYSNNGHGAEGAVRTEYTPACLQKAIRDEVYEGAKIRANHPADRRKPNVERDIDDTLGIIRNCRIESIEDGIRADLHYLSSHPMSDRVIEDIERQLGVWGLSHNSASDDDRVVNGTLLVESIAIVRSVDLVDKPATTRNLWESQMATKKITLRSLLEADRKRFSRNRQSWMTQLLEMDDAYADMETEVPAEGDSDDALWQGVRSALIATIDDDSLDAKAKLDKLKKYLNAHEKLTQAEEPEPLEESDEEEDEEGEGKKGKMESAEKDELELLRKEKKVRTLCESMEFAPDELTLRALVGLGTDADRRSFITRQKGAAGLPQQRKLQSRQPAAKDLTESQQDTTQSGESAGNVAFLKATRGED